MRAVWITTVNGMDWPKSTSPEEQQQSLREIVRKLHHARFNAIFFQVRGRGDACYQSHFEPWSQSLTGTLGKDPGWDPLAFIIREAHEQSMEVHAWFNTNVVGTNKMDFPETAPRHIVSSHRDWVKLVDGEWWLDPGIPAARKYLVQVVMDIVRSYNVDGIQFDFARYPLKPFPDDATYKRYGKNMNKEDWRRENITSFIRSCYDSISALKPWVAVGSTPIGIYRNEGKMRGLQSYDDVYQDSRGWLRQHIQDYVTPQVYWTLGDQPQDPDFAAVVRDWRANMFDRNVYIGVGAYKRDVMDELGREIDTIRSLGLEGMSFFRYENIANNLSMERRFRTLANLPRAPWKTTEPVRAPVQFQVESKGERIFALSWRPASSIDLHRTKWLNVYRSHRQSVNVDDPADLLAILPGDASEYIDTVTESGSVRWMYAVSSLDSIENESAPVQQNVVLPEVLELTKNVQLHNKLGQQYHDLASSIVYFPYEVGQRSTVTMTLVDHSDQEVLRIVHAVKQAGQYIASANISQLKKGTYTCLLIVNDHAERQSIQIE